MKILVLGASGFLGRKIYEYLKEKYNCVGTQFSQNYSDLINTDLTNKEQLNNLLEKEKPNIVINCISTPRIKGYDKISFCEAYPEEAYKLNCYLVKNLAEIFKGKIVLFSTAAVFDGEKGNYNEKDIPNPINIYGKSKLDGEEILIRNNRDYIIIRTGTLYKEGGGFIFDSLKQGKEIEIFSNVYDCPVELDYIPFFLDKLLKEDLHGIFHIPGEKLSKFQLALKIANEHGFDKNLVKPSFYTEKLIPPNTSLKTLYRLDINTEQN